MTSKPIKGILTIYGEAALKNAIDSFPVELLDSNSWKRTGWRIIPPLRFHERVFLKIRRMLISPYHFFQGLQYLIKRLFPKEKLRKKRIEADIKRFIFMD